MKNILLILGLFISLVSIGFNVFVFGFHNDLITDKEEKLNFINFSNLYLSTEFNHAENIYYKSRSIEYSINKNDESMQGLKSKRNLQIMEKDLAMLRIKSVNYAYNSTINNDTVKYDSTDFKALMKYIEKFNAQQKLNQNDLDGLKSKYFEYYRKHEKYIKGRMDEKEILKIEIKQLKKRNSWMNFMAISFQTIGLILVFLKDIKRK